MEALKSKARGPILRFPSIDLSMEAPPKHARKEYINVAKVGSLGFKTGIFRVVHTPIVEGEGTRHIVVVEAWGERMSVGLTISWFNNNQWPKALVHCELAQTNGYVRYMAKGVDPFTGIDGVLYIWCPVIWAAPDIPGIPPVFSTLPFGFAEDDREEATTIGSTSASASPTLSAPPPLRCVSNASLVQGEQAEVSPGLDGRAVGTSSKQRKGSGLRAVRSWLGSIRF